MDERDARQERMYDFDRQGEASTMAYVSSYAQQLVVEFMEFREREYQLHRTGSESVLDTLTRWEPIRFGSQLFPAAHGILAFWVRAKLLPEHGGRRLSPGYFGHGPTQAKRLPASPDAMVKNLGREMTMPHAPGRKAYEKRMAELEQQRDGLQLDVDGAK